MRDIEFIGSRHSVICTGAEIPFVQYQYQADTGNQLTVHLYFSTSQLQPTPDLGDVGDLYIRRIDCSGYGPSSIEVHWKGYRKNGIKQVWRQVFPNGEEIQHPLYPILYLQGSRWGPEWQRTGSQQRGRGDIIGSAGNFLRIHEKGSVLNPIVLS